MREEKAPRWSDSILNALPVAAYVCDGEGYVTACNTQVVELWGREPSRDHIERYCGSHRLLDCEGRPIEPTNFPVAEVLRTRSAVYARQHIVEQPSGRRVWVQVNAQPQLDDDGRLASVLSCLVEITEHKLVEAQLREREEQLHAVFATTPECIKIVAPDGALLYMNRAGLRMIEADAFATVDHRSVFSLIDPAHRAAWCEHHRRVCAGDSLSWEFDIVGLRGGHRSMETHAAPLRLPDGSVAQLAITRDVSGRKRREAQNHLLMRELNHRVKNTMAIVQSLVKQSLRGAEDITTVRKVIDARLCALASAHDVLTARSWEGAQLAEIIEAVLTVHCTQAERIRSSGPAVALSPQSALAIAIAMHELCFNAVKFGSLSNDAGYVEVSWRILHGSRDRLHLCWREHGGPEVAVPQRHGFGSRLLKLLGAQLHGEVRVHYPACGVMVEIEAMLDPPSGGAADAQEQRH